MTPDLAVTTDILTRTARHPVAIPRPDAVLRVEGPGTVECLQGIFTNDLAKGELPLLRWGAALTSKGMIVTDFWVLRTADAARLVVPAQGVEPLRQLLSRSFPPRLAKVTDESAALAPWWLLGEAGPMPDAIVASPDGPAPFDRMALLPRDRAATLLAAAGWDATHAAVGDVRAALHGFPVVGREIDEKTLPQEVRFDELEGVRYDKGCYVGQETVARLHFRGHPNRTLRAMVGSMPLPTDAVITDANGREVGSVATLTQLDHRWIASSRLRREVNTGDTVRVGGRAAVVREFPIDATEPGG